MAPFIEISVPVLVIYAGWVGNVPSVNLLLSGTLPVKRTVKAPSESRLKPRMREK